MPQLLEVKDLSVQYITGKRPVRALDSVSLSVKEEEFLALVGESGCGKTTLGLAMTGLLPRKSSKVSGGSLVYKGVDLTTLDEARAKDYRGSEIAMIFQEPLTSLNPVRRVGEQIAEGIVLSRRKKEPGRKIAGAPRFPGRKWNLSPGLRNEVEDMLNLVRIPDPAHIRDRYPFELSGGMRQRVMIAMALSQQPALLIADEPTTALDVTTQAQVLKLMKEIKDKLGMAVVLVTHDLAVASQVADRVIVMYAGQVVEDAEVRSIFQNPRHPYTQGLLSCIPKGTRDGKQLTPIRGTIPDLTVVDEACKFRARCPHAMTICGEKEPQLLEVSKDHKVACFLYGQ
jgi:oligopeptide/dipeptide ABC transporter ATP-binding protein